MLLSRSRKLCACILILCTATIIVVCCIGFRNNNSKDLTDKTELDKRNCTCLYELRHINFNDYSIRSRLCDKTMAYDIINGRHPLCQLSNQLPRDVNIEIRKEAVRTSVNSGLTGHTITVLGYKECLVGNEEIETHHISNPQLDTGIVKLLRILPKSEVTFLDVGCNIGTYSLLAADAGFPTVAVDANIRNVARLRLATLDMGWRSDRLRIFWGFIHTEAPMIRKLEYNIQARCDTGGAIAGGGGTTNAGRLKDTVPVMTAVSDDLLPHVSTRLVMLKIDIEQGERIFLEHSRLFTEKNRVIAVLMGWWHNSFSAANAENRRFLLKHFSTRDYVLLSPSTLGERDPEHYRERDALWLDRKYFTTVKDSLHWSHY